MVTSSLALYRLALYQVWVGSQLLCVMKEEFEQVPETVNFALVSIAVIATRPVSTEAMVRNLRF